jgi:hypothetical protein
MPRGHVVWLASKQAGGTNFVFVIPALEDGSLNLRPEPWIAKPTRSVDCDEESQNQSSLRPAVVISAQAVSDTRLDPASMDCLAHYDPAYDAAVYGYQANSGSSPLVMRSLSADEMMSLFVDLGVPQASQQQHVPSFEFGEPCLRFTALTVAARGWLVYQWHHLIDELPRFATNFDNPSDYLEWQEYGELIDSAAAATAQDALESQMYRLHVRFSGGVHHSAATVFEGWGTVYGGTKVDFVP